MFLSCTATEAFKCESALPASSHLHHIGHASTHHVEKLPRGDLGRDVIAIRSLPRALAKRDITVPGGQFRTVAIS